ncbi:MAG: rRNA maturation RNase YbeY [Hyphomicrobiales bacterium]|nr:rRNA maturation RNase YbeY [Hyphomicrobiales bacterium]
MSGPTDIVVRADAWRNLRGARRVVERAIDACRLALGRTDEKAETCVVLCDDAEIRRLNGRWRGFDKATNVLSFPANAGSQGASLGDIAIAYETVAGEAVAENKALPAHLSHMVVHGYLHLVGYDHEDERDAEQMEDMERQILGVLGIDDPYASDDSASKRRRTR